MTEFIIGPIEALINQEISDNRSKRLLLDFYQSYSKATAAYHDKDKINALFKTLLTLILEQMRSPRTFDVFHQSIRSPFDYYQFGLDFIRPLIDFEHSKISGDAIWNQIDKQIENKNNVILLSNHQTEPDPQIISLLLEKNHPSLATDMIFVAGHRVIQDPLAIPLSLGRHLLCIYSKKHMSHLSVDEKNANMMHNQRTMKRMAELLDRGGCCIYVAPSGGRDRLNADGKPTVAAFDPQSIELFCLLAKAASKTTHFYPLALHTFDLMPPPKRVEKELGEKRVVQRTAVSLCIGQEIEMENFPSSDKLDKRAKRQKRSEYIWQLVSNQYGSGIL